MSGEDPPLLRLPHYLQKKLPLHLSRSFTYMTKFKTRNDLPEKVRTQVATLIQQQLVNAIDLGLQCKQAHWNVKGPNFIAMHELFDKVAEDVEEYVDTFAERIVQLGQVSDGTAQTVAHSTTLPPYPLTAITAADHVNALARGLATFGEEIRKAIDSADELNDRDTADIFTEASRNIDKNLWFVEAHLQSE